MKWVLLRFLSVVWLSAAGSGALAQQLPPTHSAVELPGRRPDGSVLLPNQWSLWPAGKQVPLGDFPVNIAVHPDGHYAAVLHSGHGQHEIIVVDVDAARAVSRTKINEAFYGLEFSSSGSRLYCSGSADEVIHVFDFHSGNLTEIEPIRLRDAKEWGIPCGLVVAGNARDLYVANVWGQTVTKLDLLTRSKVMELIPNPADWSGTLLNTNLSTEETTSVEEEDLVRWDKSKPDPRTVAAPFPYACRLDERRQLLYVSLWAQSAVSVIDLKSNQVKTWWATEEHPNEMVLTKSGRYLFVANANRNTVTMLDTTVGDVVQTLYASRSPGMLPGSTPNSLALTPDENTLFVANACNNNVAVFDVSNPGKSRSLGFIPTGWYPTSVRVTPDGRHLLVANGKGLSSQANPNGPSPMTKRTPATQHIDELFPGTLSIIDLPKGSAFRRQMAEYTAAAYRCTPQQSANQVQAAADNPVPSKPGKPSPIKYCIYVIKENRTYDQILGDMPEGNGDPKLCLFPEKITPNHHQLAREFVLLDNFYADAEVSADGHEWSMGAYASDFVEKTWPLSYGHNKSKKFPYPAEGEFPIAAPAGGYIWDRAREAGVSYRSFGEFILTGRTAKDPGYTRVGALKDHFDPWYRGWDLDYTDVKRAERYLAELKRFESEGEMPRLQIVRLPSDHTSGTKAGKPTPSAYLADNDRALGTLVEAVSHSKFWPQTAIFVVEDDAQDGPDHVDAHRTVALVASPFTRRGAVDSTMYSTSSMLRTMELILGLKPMTQFDSAATPMFNAFQAKSDARPYDALAESVDVNQTNLASSWGSKESGKMNFSKEDAADDHLLNDVVWRSVRGADSPMPAPTRAAFVMTRAKKDDD